MDGWHWMGLDDDFQIRQVLLDCSVLLGSLDLVFLVLMNKYIVPKEGIVPSFGVRLRVIRHVGVRP